MSNISSFCPLSSFGRLIADVCPAANKRPDISVKAVGDLSAAVGEIIANARLQLLLIPIIISRN